MSQKFLKFTSESLYASYISFPYSSAKMGLCALQKR